MNNSKENIITLLVACSVLSFFVFTPGRETLGPAVQGFIMTLIFFALVPLGYHFLILKKARNEFGIGIAAWKTRIWLIAPVVLGALIITVLLSRFIPTLHESLLLPPVIKGSFGLFVGYELLLVPALIAVYEIFFRGFVQKSWLERYWGFWAIIAQGAFFLLFLLLTVSFGWAAFPFILFSFFSGFLVWYNNSLLQSWIAHWLYILLLDVILLITR